MPLRRIIFRYALKVPAEKRGKIELNVQLRIPPFLQFHRIYFRRKREQNGETFFLSKLVDISKWLGQQNMAL